jgi:hypothetical protein
MYWAVTVILLANWVLGLVSGAALGGWIHLMFVAALIALALAVVTTAAHRRPATTFDGSSDDHLGG